MGRVVNKHTLDAYENSRAPASLSPRKGGESPKKGGSPKKGTRLTSSKMTGTGFLSFHSKHVNFGGPAPYKPPPPGTHAPAPFVPTPVASSAAPTPPIVDTSVAPVNNW